MNTTRSKLLDNRNTYDNNALVSQLEREILCLERQLDRLRLLDDRMDRRTLITYEEMISSRKAMLSELSF